MAAVLLGLAWWVAVPSTGVGAQSASPRATGSSPRLELTQYPVPAGAHPHDVAPAADGGVWYTGQANGTLGRLDPASGAVEEVDLGQSSAPHGVVVGPDAAPWVTDGGANAIVRVDPATREVTRFPLPDDRAGANLNTLAFDGSGVLWFTGQAGVYGRLDPATGELTVYDAPGGRGPYGITATPSGEVWYASLAGSHIARIDPASGTAMVVEPPTAEQGARRIWADSAGRLWISEWDAGQLGRYDPALEVWEEWHVEGVGPRPYAVFVDDADVVWLTDFGANAIVRFDPLTLEQLAIALPEAGAEVRQLAGRPGEVWGAESGLDRLVVVRTGPAGTSSAEGAGTPSPEG
jgi:virginiamycin B lyase